jgi:ribonuclease T1
MFVNLSWIKTLCGARVLSLFVLGLAVCLTLVATPAIANSLYFTEYNQHVTSTALPQEARETLRLIKQGGPFPYTRDGQVFGNYEKRLPQQQRGYYHEYTVTTPGLRNRGARRIVCGQPVECYYSDDHYKTFKRIME